MKNIIKITRRKLMFAGAMAPVIMSMPGRVMAQSQAQAGGYYKDKVIIINVAGGASGGHTRFARLLQPYLQKHSGAREVRIVNMPGGAKISDVNGQA